MTDFQMITGRVWSLQLAQHYLLVQLFGQMTNVLSNVVTRNSLPGPFSPEAIEQALLLQELWTNVHQSLDEGMATGLDAALNLLGRSTGLLTSGRNELLIAMEQVPELQAEPLAQLTAALLKHMLEETNFVEVQLTLPTGEQDQLLENAFWERHDEEVKEATKLLKKSMPFMIEAFRVQSREYQAHIMKGLWESAARRTSTFEEAVEEGIEAHEHREDEYFKWLNWYIQQLSTENAQYARI